MTLKFTRRQYLDLFILLLRWYLAYYMFDYGIGKITGEQFGVYNPRLLDMPLREVNKFYLAWHLFGMSPVFNITVGLLQIFGAILIVVNRTMLIGAFFLLPLLFNILLVDIAFTTGMFGSALPVRLCCMILSDIIVLWYYRDKVLAAWYMLTRAVSTQFRYKWWLFLLLPFMGLAMDFFWMLVSSPVVWLINRLSIHH